MKITIEEPPFYYSANWDHENKVEDGFLEEYHVEVEEAVDAALTLLSKIYSPQQVAKAIRTTDYYELYYKEGETDDTEGVEGLE